MTSYEFPTPHALFGAIAVALTALTIGLFAVLPATTGPSEHVQEIASAAPAQSAARSIAAPAETRQIDAIEVVGVRAPKVISAQDRVVPVKRGDQG